MGDVQGGDENPLARASVVQGNGKTGRARRKGARPWGPEAGMAGGREVETSGRKGSFHQLHPGSLDGPRARPGIRSLWLSVWSGVEVLMGLADFF